MKIEQAFVLCPDCGVLVQQRRDFISYHGEQGCPAIQSIKPLPAFFLTMYHQDKVAQ